MKQAPSKAAITKQNKAKSSPVIASRNMQTTAAFPNVRLHQVDPQEEPAFGGLRFHKVDSDVVLGSNHKATWIEEAKAARAERRARMQPNPVSCVRDAIGKRPTMEDQHVSLDNCLPVFTRLPDGVSVGYWAVYDGHGGTEAALLVKELLLPRIMSNMCDTPGDIEGALRRAFSEVDSIVCARLGDAGKSCGCTAAVALLVNRTLYVANVGDAEAILGADNAALASLSSQSTAASNAQSSNASNRSSQSAPTVSPSPSPSPSSSSSSCVVTLLTHAHKASAPDERARIEAAGGKLFAGRIFGTLAIARAFGDSEFKAAAQSNASSPDSSAGNYVSCEPHITKMELAAEHQFIVLACDGLWDRVTHDECARFTSKLLRLKSIEDAADFLVAEALDRNSKDNVTVVVVALNWSLPIAPRNDAGDSGADLNGSALQLHDLTPGFVQFLTAANLLHENERFSRSDLARRIASPAREQKAQRAKKPVHPVDGGSGGASRQVGHDVVVREEEDVDSGVTVSDDVDVAFVVAQSGAQHSAVQHAVRNVQTGAPSALDDDDDDDYTDECVVQQPGAELYILNAF